MRPQMVIYPLSGGMKMVKIKSKLWYFGKCLIKLIQFLSKRKTMAKFFYGLCFFIGACNIPVYVVCMHFLVLSSLLSALSSGCPNTSLVFIDTTWWGEAL